MDNLFFNASHSDAAPAQAITRPKLALKGIEPKGAQSTSEKPLQPVDALDISSPSGSTSMPDKLVFKLPEPDPSHHVASHPLTRMMRPPALLDAQQGTPSPSSDASATPTQSNSAKAADAHP